MLECLESGILPPSARQVAERAGISSRGVFRHFDSMEKLLEAVAALQLERIAPKLPALVLEGGLDRRLDALIERSLTRNESIAPVRRAALLAEPFSEVVSRNHAWLRRSVEDEVRRALAAELEAVEDAGARRTLIVSVRALVSFSHWEELCRHGGLAREAIAHAIRAEVLGLLVLGGRIDAAAVRGMLARATRRPRTGRVRSTP